MTGTPVTHALQGEHSLLVDQRQSLTALLKRGYSLRVEIDGQQVAACILQGGAYFVLTGDSGTLRLRADDTPEADFLTHWRLFVAENAQLLRRRS